MANPFIKTLKSFMPEEQPVMASEQEKYAKLAEMLRKKSDEPLNGQMVSGHYVAPSWTQHAAKLATALMGNATERKAEAAKRQGQVDFRDTASKYAAALRGTDEQQTPYQADNAFDEDLGNLQTVTPAQPGSQEAANNIALDSNSPIWQEIAMKNLTKQPEGPKWQVQDRYNPESGRKEKVMVDMNNPNSVLPFGGQEAVEGKIAPNGVAYDPYALTPGQVFNDPNKPFNADGTPNPAYQKYETTKAEKGATRVGINNITTQEGEQSKTYGGGLGDVRIDLQKAGFSAPSKIANLNRMEQLLDGVEGGKLAKPGMTIASAAKSLGVEIDPRLGDKEAAEALAVDMALKMKEPGTGPMTDKDFENFMTTVPSLAKTSGGRKQIIHTLRAKATRDMEIAKMAREYARTHNGVIDDGFLDEASSYMAKNPIFKQPVSSTTRARADQILGGG